ncbi:hypothetical protein, partial [Bifidobacterium pseudocatenulatum]|uniref:hypothetical protein n=1 Tax=Bifidobacterium pseudocatenulatum TaxID=28026 RepID=UPI0034A32790
MVVGPASVGKTTLVTRLSKLYDAPIAVEYAREFEEACNVDDDELTAFDYERLILVVPEKLRTLDRGRPWRDSQFASTRL